jgi:LPPG:FO 2-phospho-L-lactate transferase
VIESILQSTAVIICPSNPLISIGPILAVPGIRQALRDTGATVAAISPVVGGASLKGPTDRMLSDLGLEVSAGQVAELYADFLDIFVLDRQDESARPEIERRGLQVLTADTVMSDSEKKLSLARTVLAIFD